MLATCRAVVWLLSSASVSVGLTAQFQVDMLLQVDFVSPVDMLAQVDMEGVVKFLLLLLLFFITLEPRVE